MMTRDKLAELIAAHLGEGNETDNLGDGESICFLGELPTVNVAELAEKIMETYAREDAREEFCPHCNSQWKDHTCP